MSGDNTRPGGDSGSDQDLLAEILGQTRGRSQPDTGQDNQSVTQAQGQIDHYLAQIDALLSAQVSEILHHPDFQKLEASWRGLRFLVEEAKGEASVKVRVLSVGKDDLSRDLEQAREFEEGELYRLFLADASETASQLPFGAIVGDYEFGPGAEDVELLAHIGQVAMAHHAPFLAAAAPAMFGCARFTDLGRGHSLSEILRGADHAKWRTFRERPESVFVALCLPSILLRAPYSPFTRPFKTFDLLEESAAENHYLWGNPAYALAVCLAEAFARSGWFPSLCGPDQGGEVAGLASALIKTSETDSGAKRPTAVSLPERIAREMVELGFVPLVHMAHNDVAAFVATPTCHRPKLYDRDDATSTAYLSVQLPYLLVASRFAHYLKAAAADLVPGAFPRRDDLAQALNRWIGDYVAEQATADQDAQRRHPLVEGRVEVQDDPSRPGAFIAILSLRPDYLLDPPPRALRIGVPLPFGRR
jgi:type VI secretion system protein ImpC